MPIEITCLVAVLSTTAFMMLWFWVVHREMRARRNTVESARLQWMVRHREYELGTAGFERQDAQNTLACSLDVYRQSIRLYNATLQKIWNFIPGHLMGFGMLDEEKRCSLL